jgi:glycosyltransferase involved in cell wall biosynthesis
LCTQAGEHNNNVIQSHFKFEHYSRAIFDKLKSLKADNLLLNKSEFVVSFVSPVYKTPLLYLQQLLSSLESQTYSKWELCLAGGELDSHALAYLNYKLLSDKRIKYQEVESENQGISANTNSAISISTGNYIALLDHDDLLPPHCVLELLYSHISEDADFIYTAEDKVDSSGLRFYAPVYKTDFSEDLLLTHNYITHLTSYSRNLLAKVGLFDSNFDGAQDYDFILRASLQATKIFYLPKILYHWRVFGGSTSDGRSVSKPYAVEAGKNAISAYLVQKGHNNFHVNYGKLPFTYDVELDDL